MIPIKSKKEIETMKEGGRILAKVMAAVIESARPGVQTKALDALAERLIVKNGAKSSFKMVKGYNFTSCLNINDGLVHGIPGDYRIKVGDVVTVDLGVYYKRFHSDMARTFQLAANSSSSEVRRFLKVGQSALKNATIAAKPGNHIGHISKAIQETVEKAGYRPSRKFSGHGVGKKLHEEPRIPCFLEGRIEKTPKLKEGMVLAIEVIYAQGKPGVKIAKDGWTAKTVDGKLGGLFENTVAISGVGTIVLTMV